MVFPWTKSTPASKGVVVDLTRQQRLGGFGSGLDLIFRLTPRKRAAFTLIILALVGFSDARAAAKTVTIGGPFELKASDGTTVSDVSYRGKWLLVFFGYTFCPDFCPTTLAVVAEALDALGDDAAQVQPIFITVDPERDTPEVMGEYVAAFDQRIAGLTGTPQQIAAVADAYGAYYKVQSPDVANHNYFVDHSTYFYIMDPDGKFVRGLHYDATSEFIAEAMLRLINRH